MFHFYFNTVLKYLLYFDSIVSKRNKQYTWMLFYTNRHSLHVGVCFYDSGIILKPKKLNFFNNPNCRNEPN